MKTNEEDEWIVLAPRSPWCLTEILLRKETDHNNFALNILVFELYPFPESESNAITRVANLVN